MPRRRKPGAGRTRDSASGAVTSLTYPATRKNLPPAGIEAHGVVREAPAVRYAFNPHLPPALRSSPEPAKADRLPELLAAARQRALTVEEADELAEALTLAKHRLMTAKFDYYRLRELNAEDVARNREGTWIAEVDDDGRPTGRRMTFDCRSVPHVTLRSIARNTSLDPIFARHEPILDGALALLNRALETVDAELKEKLVGKLVAKHREGGARAVTDADVRRWLLPGGDPAWIRPAAARQPLKGLTARQAGKYREQMLSRALGNQGTVEPAAFDALSGFRSLPFARPARLGDEEIWKVAVKVIDPRGNEGLRVLTEGGRWA